MENSKQLAYECISSFYVFFVTFWDVNVQDEYQDNWHIHFLCQKMEDYGYKIAKKEDIDGDLLINVPPSSSKSSIVSQAFNAWLWLHAPWACVLSSSYSYDLAMGNSRKTKAIVESDKYKKLFNGYFKKRFGKELKITKNTERYYENNFGGFRFSTGTDGGVMGRHAHVILIDDPLKMSQAGSKVYRDRANEFNGKALVTRKKQVGKSLTVLVMQRLHHNDTTAYLLQKAEEKNKKVDHVVLPAFANKAIKPYYLKRFYKNGLLDPNRLSKSALSDFKIDLGTYAYEGQYGQEPSPEEGGKVKRSWFRYCTPDQLPENLQLDLFIDGAYTENAKNDPSGLMFCGYDKVTSTLYILNWESKYLGMPAMLDYLKKVWGKLPRWEKYKSKHYIEPKATGYSLHQHIVSKNQRSELIKDNMCDNLVKEGKEARVQAAAPIIENGQVVLLTGLWNDGFIDEICNFPNAEHDEAVDLIGYASKIYFKKGANGVTVHT